MAGSPSAVAFHEKLYVFHIYDPTELHKGFIAYDWFDGTTWKGSTAAPSGNNENGITGSPAAVVYNSSIYLFYQGWGDHIGELWFTASSDGLNWSDPNHIPTVGMSESPAAVVYKEVLYVLHQGARQNGKLWFTVFDGMNWSGDQPIADIGMSASPSACVFPAPSV